MLDTNKLLQGSRTELPKFWTQTNSSAACLLAASVLDTEMVQAASGAGPLDSSLVSCSTYTGRKCCQQPAELLGGTLFFCSLLVLCTDGSLPLAAVSDICGSLVGACNAHQPLVYPAALCAGPSYALYGSPSTV